MCWGFLGRPGRPPAGLLRPSGVFWGFLRLWQPPARFLSSPAAFWSFLELSRGSCGFPEVPGGFWCLLTRPAASWGFPRLSGNLLLVFWVSCRFLGPAGVSAAFWEPLFFGASCGFQWLAMFSNALKHVSMQASKHACMSIAPHPTSEKTMPAWSFTLVVLGFSGASWGVSCRPPAAFWGFLALCAPHTRF